MLGSPSPPMPLSSMTFSDQAGGGNRPAVRSKPNALRAWQADTSYVSALVHSTLGCHLGCPAGKPESPGGSPGHHSLSVDVEPCRRGGSEQTAPGNWADQAASGWHHRRRRTTGGPSNPLSTPLFPFPSLSRPSLSPSPPPFPSHHQNPPHATTSARTWIRHLSLSLSFLEADSTITTLRHRRLRSSLTLVVLSIPSFSSACLPGHLSITAHSRGSGRVLTASTPRPPVCRYVNDAISASVRDGLQTSTTPLHHLLCLILFASPSLLGLVP